MSQSQRSANLCAATILCASDSMRAHGLQAPTATAVLKATQATKTQAYELRKALDTLLPSLERAPGRPRNPRPLSGAELESDGAQLRAISREFISYLYDHPGAISRGDHRLNASPEALRHVVELRHQHGDIGVEQLALAISIPASTLRQWLRDADDLESGVRQLSHDSVDALNVRRVHVQTVLSAWQSWEGSFSVFVSHIREDHAIDLGRTAIASMLELAGVRARKKRPGRSPDEKALRGSFLTFFPGAQWTADGKTVNIELNGQHYSFNLELMVDTYTAAYVGIEVRDEEDAKGVIAAYTDGLKTTGHAPIAVLLDNKACNWTDEVGVSMGNSLCIAATRARPQNKAHVEGAFGLFSQQVPELAIVAATDRGVARAIVELIARTFFGALNMRPRKSRGNRSRIDLYREDPPTKETVKAAENALKARYDRQEQAKLTRRAREAPGVREYLDATFERLKLEDPTGHVRDAIARYALADIADGVAIFTAKQQEDKLPDELHEPARYLLGIIRNIEQTREGTAIARALWDERMTARERAIEHLQEKREELTRANLEPKSRLHETVDEAFRTSSGIERHFWLSTTAMMITEQAQHLQRSLYEWVARRINTAFRTPYAERLESVRFLANRVLPLQ